MLVVVLIPHYSSPVPSSLAMVCVCSNGTGRTGAFIGLSVALEHVRTEGMVDVYGIVKNLRTQRPHMVQTLVGSRCIMQTATHSQTATHAQRQVWRCL